jgi:hypothetical protein
VERDIVATKPPSDRRGLFLGAFLLIGAILAGMAIALPLALTSVLDDVVQPPESAVYPVVLASDAPVAATNARLHLAIVDLDEARLLATLRVSGHLACEQACGFAERVVLFSLGTNEALTAGMPPSASVDFSTSQRLISSTVTLPLRGNPSRYPFDTYDLRLAVGMARVYSDDNVQPLSRADAAGHLFLTLQEQLPRENLQPPTALDPMAGEEAGDIMPYLALVDLAFERPVHDRVITILLVVLIAAAAAYAVFMRPLHDLVINSGALVLGVWGIRAILTPGTAYRTIVDTALSAVILFLLGAITVRALQFCYSRAGLRLRPTRRPAADPPADAED